MTTVHGGLDTAELRRLGLMPEQLVDFSSNINPLGPSPRVREAASKADLSAYPDRHCLELREALSGRLGVDIQNILLGNGSVQLIHLEARALLSPGQSCVIFGPTFGEYEEAATLAGGEVHFLRAEEADGFRWSINDSVTAIKRIRPRLVFLCNPNNPTGVFLDREEVQRIRDAVGRSGLLVLDDSYSSLADHPWDAIPLLKLGNVAILRSMTKEHALAGVRLGYMIAETSVVSATARLQPSWSVNAVAQATGLAALKDDGHVEDAREVVAASKAYLYRELVSLGLTVKPSAANFLLVRVGNGAKVRGALLKRCIVVRDCSSFGLPEHIRIAVRRPEECQRLIQFLREVLGNE